MNKIEIMNHLDKWTNDKIKKTLANIAYTLSIDIPENSSLCGNIVDDQVYSIKDTINDLAYENAKLKIENKGLKDYLDFLAKEDVCNCDYRDEDCMCEDEMIACDHVSNTDTCDDKNDHYDKNNDQKDFCPNEYKEEICKGKCEFEDECKESISLSNFLSSVLNKIFENDDIDNKKDENSEKNKSVDEQAEEIEKKLNDIIIKLGKDFTDNNAWKEYTDMLNEDIPLDVMKTFIKKYGRYGKEGV